MPAGTQVYLGRRAGSHLELYRQIPVINTRAAEELFGRTQADNRSDRYMVLAVPDHRDGNLAITDEKPIALTQALELDAD